MDFLDSDEFGTVLKIAASKPVDSNSPGESESKNIDITATTPSVLSSRYIPADPATIKNGALSSNLPGHGGTPYYLSTAIAYTNGYPHVGHAYEVSVLILPRNSTQGQYSFSLQILSLDFIVHWVLTLSF